MKKIVLGLGCLFLCCVDVHARVITESVSGGSISYGEDIVLGQNVLFMPKRMNVTKSMTIENNGRFHTDIYVCDMCELYVQNRGEFSANVNLGNQSALYRVITGTDDLGNIDFGADYSVWVHDATSLTLDNVMDSAVGAGRIIIQDSVLDLNDVGAWYAGNFELRGDIVLRIEYGAGNDVRPVLNNVSGDARVTVESTDTDIMYTDYGYISDATLYIGRRRETDYAKILRNDMGMFLNTLRDENSDDGLLMALDSAADINALYDVMSESVRLNPDVLLDVVRIVGAFSPRDNGDNSVGFAPFVIMSDNFHSYGVDICAQIWMNKNLNVGIGIRAGVLDYSSSFDEFSMLFYGLGAVADYVFDNNLFVHGELNMEEFDSDIESVFWKNKVINNPSVIGINADIDIGYKYTFGDSFYVAPFVGVGADWYSSDVVERWTTPIRGGINAGYGFEMLGISYEYGTGINISSDGALSVMGRVGIWSDYDMVGGDASIEIVRMFGMTSCKISVGGKLWF